MSASVDFCECWPEPCVHQPIVPANAEAEVPC